MKNNICILFICVVQNLMVGQPVAPWGIFTISDVPSNVGSGANTVEYLIMRSREAALTRNVKKFQEQYTDRLKYFSGVLIVNKINTQLDLARDRAITLRQNNNDLSLFFYSRKKDNLTYLDTVDQAISNLIIELSKQSVSVIYGEKMNLYQNLMRSLTKINRQMDLIQDGIEKSRLTEYVLEKQ